MTTPFALSNLAIRKFALPRVKAPQALKNLLSMPLTVAGIGVCVAGISLIFLPAGLIVLGVALVVVEYAVADE